MVTTPLTKNITKKLTLNQFPQMHKPQLPDIVHNWEILDPDKDLRKDILIRLIPTDRHLIRYLIQLRQDKLWLQPHPHCNHR